MAGLFCSPRLDSYPTRTWGDLPLGRISIVGCAACRGSVSLCWCVSLSPSGAGMTPPKTAPARRARRAGQRPGPRGDGAFDRVLVAVGEPTDRYGDPSLWACRGLPTDEICTTGLATTVIAKDGAEEMVVRRSAEDPGADCFYVYPTVDLRQEPGNAALVDTADMELMVHQQAAPFSPLCRVFAPMYEQASIGSYDLGGPEPPDLTTPEFEAAYDQILDAFRWYMANENGGRPVVLLGHSQGSHHLARLAGELFDARAELADQLVMAALIGAGGSANVPEGSVVGGASRRSRCAPVWKRRAVLLPTTPTT